MRSTAAFMVPEVGDGQDDRKFAVILVFFLMGIRKRGKGTGAIRLSSLKSQIPADCAPSPEGAPGTLPGSWHFAGKCARSGSQARLRRAAPCSPAPAPSLGRRLPPLVPAPRSRSPALPPARALPSSLGRFWLRGAPRWVCAPLRPPPPSPGSPQGGVRAVSGAGRPGAGDGRARTCGQSLAAAQSERKVGGATVERGAQPAGPGPRAREPRTPREQAACRGSPTTSGKSP